MDSFYIKEQFYKGKYNDVISTISPKNTHTSINQLDSLTGSLYIASLIFTGSFLKAEQLFEEYSQRKHPTSDIIRAQFFLAVGYVRRSLYEKAEKAFTNNWSLIRNKNTTEDPNDFESNFYCNQGSAFMSQYKGRYQKSLYWGEKAYFASLKSKIPFTEILALDLISNSLFLKGEVQRGLLENQKAQAIAQTLGQGGILAALKMSQITFSADFGIDIKNTIANLEEAIADLPIEDTYSVAQLKLELVKQHILRGNTTLAQKILDETADSVYRFQNKRQYATYNLRSAYLLYFRGEFHAALALVSALKMNLNPKVDVNLNRQSNGLKQLIEKELNLVSNQDYLMPFLSEKDFKIQNRSHNKETQLRNRGEDKMGDLIDSVHIEKEKKIPELINLGLYGLIYKALNLSPKTKGIYFGPSRGSAVLIYKGDVKIIKKGLQLPIKKLLLCLKNKNYLSKEDLVQLIWGYSYDPAIHDSLLYSTLTKTRKLLGDFQGWIERNENGYRLNDEIDLFVTQNQEGETTGLENNVITKANKTSIENREFDSDFVNPKLANLNYRQLNSLNYLQKIQYINVKEYAKKYNITQMTAYRDLNELFLKKHVKRIGKGRATVYISRKKGAYL